MQNRVRSISLLHASMHRPGTKATVDLGSYIRLLTAHLVKAHLIPATAIQVVLEVDELTVGMVQATTVGLLVNELVMNCLKHGFPDGGSGEIHIGLQRVGAGPQWRLLVQDNGVGLPADFARRRELQLGLQLVKDLSGQIGAALDIEAIQPSGVAFGVTFTPDVTSGRQTP